MGQKIHEFTVQENRNLWLSKEDLLEKYMYADIHKIFFCTFPIELYEWLSKLIDTQERWKLDNLIVWTLELVRTLEASEDKIM